MLRSVGRLTEAKTVVAITNHSGGHWSPVIDQTLDFECIYDYDTMGTPLECEKEKT